MDGSICTAIPHISCVKRRSGTDSNTHGFFSTVFPHISWVLRWSGIKENSTEDKRSNTSSEVIKIMPVSMSTASSHISWILKWSGTDLKFDRLWATASSHISCVFKWSGTYFNDHGFMLTVLLHISGVLKWSRTNLRFDGLRATASLHIFWTSGIYCSKLCKEAHDRSFRSVYGTLSLRMRSSHAYFL